MWYYSEEAGHIYGILLPWWPRRGEATLEVMDADEPVEIYKISSLD